MLLLKDMDMLVIAKNTFYNKDDINSLTKMLYNKWLWEILTCNHLQTDIQAVNWDQHLICFGWKIKIKIIIVYLRKFTHQLISVYGRMWNLSLIKYHFPPSNQYTYVHILTHLVIYFNGNIARWSSLALCIIVEDLKFGL